MLQAKNADYALIFTDEWRRVGEQKILDFSFVLMCFPPQGNTCRPPNGIIHIGVLYFVTVYR